MFLREFFNLEEKPGCNMTNEGRACPEHGLAECPGYKMIETSAQEKLHQSHQELRKKSGLPNPNYYKELKATFDLPPAERFARAAELKKKYKVKEQAITGHGQFTTKDMGGGAKVSFDPTTGGKTISGATGTTSYNVAGQKTSYQTPTIGGTSQTTNYQTGEKTTTINQGPVSASMTQRPDQSTVTSATAQLGDVSVGSHQGIGFGGAGKDVGQGGNKISTVTNPQGKTTSFAGRVPTEKEIDSAMNEKNEANVSAAQLRKDISDYNKDPTINQSTSIPNERKAQLRKAVSDYNKKQDVKEAGPFSYGAKKPRKGSVADLAAKKRKEQEKDKQPVEPKDHMVGVARVIKDVREAIPYALSAANAAAEYQRQGNRHKGRIDIPVQSREDYLAVGQALTKAARTAGHKIEYGRVGNEMSIFSDTMNSDELNQFIDAVLNQGLAEDQEDIVAVIDGVRSDRTYNDRYHAHNSLSKLVGYGKAKVAELYINGEKVEHFELGKKYIDFEPKSLDSTMSESSGITKLNDYDTWLDRVDSLGAEKHMQKNQTLLVAQSWDGEKVGEFDIKRNQGWVMSPGISEGTGEKLLGKMIPGGASAFNALDAVRRYKSGDKVGAGIAAAGTIPITSIPAAAVDMARDKYYTGSFLPSDEQRDLANLDRQVADMEKKNWTKLPDGSERSPDGRTIRGPITKAPDEVTNEGIEQYLEELSRAGYEVITETAELCPECGGPAFADQLLAEKKDACYSKVKSRYKVWPSAYASGALVRCRKVGAKNWGNKSKK